VIQKLWWRSHGRPKKQHGPRWWRGKRRRARGSGAAWGDGAATDGGSGGGATMDGRGSSKSMMCSKTKSRNRCDVVVRCTQVQRAVGKKIA